MESISPKVLLNQTASIIAHTNTGWSNTEIVKKFNEACLKYGKSFEYEKDQYQLKAAAMINNFAKFSEKEVYHVLKTFFRDEKFKDNTAIQIALNTLIKDNAFDYEDSDEHDQETFKTTSHFLEAYTASHSQYVSAYQKITAKIHERNALDDLRLSLELLVKDLLNNNRSLENNVAELGKKLKEKGITGEINTLFNRVINFYTTYQNEYVKHNDAVEPNNVEFIFDITSSMLKYLCRVF
ncbi:MAG: hypothetical protein RBQ91_04405 [Acholeplasma sp.]|nr:hypothetical protein [Acholeplasma sp.]